MSKNIMIFILLLTKLCYGAELVKLYDNYVSTDTEFRNIIIDYNILDAKRKQINSKRLPHLSLSSNLYEYSGVYDYNNIQAKYLGYTFDVEIYFSKNVELTFTLLQNIYSGEMIYDSLRMNKKERELLDIRKFRKREELLANFFKDYLDLMILRKRTKLIENEHKIHRNRVEVLENRYRGAESTELEMERLKLKNILNKHDLLEIELNDHLSDLIHRTDTEEIPLDLSLPLFVPSVNAGTNSAIEMFNTMLDIKDIEIALSTNSFKPTIDAFFTYGFKDHEMKRLKDGYFAGFVVNWNIFDGNLYKNRNTQIKREKEKIDNMRSDLVKDHERNIDDLAVQVKILVNICENDRKMIELQRKLFNESLSDFAAGKITTARFHEEENLLLALELIFYENYVPYILKLIELYVRSGNSDYFWEEFK